MSSQQTVFLLDIDNTLIDHDELKRSVTARIEALAPSQKARDFWAVYEHIRRELGIVDFLEAARRFDGPGGPLECFLWDFPFECLLLPGTRRGWEWLARRGELAVLCDGERRFQERKLERIGLASSLAHVFVFVHKEDHFGEVDSRFPGARFVLFDDKPRILRAASEFFANRITPVHVRHGHYATEAFEGLAVSSLAEFPHAAPAGFFELD